MSIQKKFSLVLTLVVIIVGFGLVIITHNWLYSIFKKERIQEVTRQVSQIKQRIFENLQNKPYVSILKANLEKVGIKKEFFILNRDLEIIYPKVQLTSSEKRDIVQNYSTTLKTESGKVPLFIDENNGSLQFIFKTTLIDNTESVYYVSLYRDIFPENVSSLLMLFYVTILILGCCIWFISYQFTGRFFSVVLAITRSLKYYLENQNTQMIDYDKKDEIGELINTYNKFINSLEVSDEPKIIESTISSSLKSTSVSTHKKNQRNSLFPQYDNLDISFFPKNTASDNNVVIVFEQGGRDELHCLVLETHTDKIEASAWKEKLKEYFIDLVQNNFEPKEIVSKLLNSTKVAEMKTLGSALFYGNFNTETSKMLLCKTGHFTLYTQIYTQNPFKSIETFKYCFNRFSCWIYRFCREKILYQVVILFY